jgi:hypothetical protein
MRPVCCRRSLEGGLSTWSTDEEMHFPKTCCCLQQAKHSNPVLWFCLLCAGLLRAGCPLGALLMTGLLSALPIIVFEYMNCFVCCVQVS